MDARFPLKGAGSRNVSKLLSKRQLSSIMDCLYQRFSVTFLKIKALF